MEGTAKSYSGWSFDDIVFDQRNKEYGAYDLRKTTKKNAGLGLLIAAGITALLLITLKIDWASLAPKKEVVVETSVTLAEPPPLNEYAPPPPPPPPPRPRTARPARTRRTTRRPQANGVGVRFSSGLKHSWTLRV